MMVRAFVFNVKILLLPSFQSQSAILFSPLYDSLLSPRIHVVGGCMIERLVRGAVVRGNALINGFSQLIGRTKDDQAQLLLDPPVKPLRITKTHLIK
jgi:hypothetical protein